MSHFSVSLDKPEHESLVLTSCNLLSMSVCVCVYSVDPPRNITIYVPHNIEVGAAFYCSVDASPPVSRYVWRRLPSGVVLGTQQTLTLTDYIAVGQFKFNYVCNY